MSDASQGPGWWQASDGKWYPPEQAPQQAAPTGPPPGSAPGAMPGYGAPAMGGAGGSAHGQLIEWPQRVMATLVDFGFVLVGYIALFIIVAILGAISDTLGALVFILGYLVLSVAWFYFAFLTGARGQSPGKQIIGIKVVAEETGQPIGGGMGIVRQIAHFLDGICLIGYLFPLWDPKKQTFADKIIKTVVVPGEKKSFGPELFKP